MDSKQRSRSLAWLLPEVASSVAAMAEALQDFQALPGEEPRVRCAEELARLRGCLKIAQCPGAVLLVEELAAVLDYIASDPSRVESDSYEVLITGLDSLARYLDKVAATGDDEPRMLIAVLNDLRAARHQPLYSETPLFAPDLSLIEKGTQGMPAVSDEALRDFVRNLRRVYQTALLGVIKGYSLSTNLGYLEKTCTRLEELSARTHREYLWYVARTFVKLLTERAIPIGGGVKLLLRALEREMQRIGEHGLATYREPYPKKLLSNLLYYIAAAPASDNADARIVRNMFGLDGEREGFYTPLSDADDRTLAAIAAELASDIERLRELIELLRGDDSPQGGTLEEARMCVLAMADSLSVADEPLRRSAQSLAQALAEACGGSSLTEATVAALAEQVVVFEAQVARWAAALNADAFADSTALDGESAVDGARMAVAAQVSAALGDIETAIQDYASARDEVEPLRPLPAALSELAAGLRIAEYGEAAALLDLGRDYIQCLLEGALGPDWGQLEAMADLVVAVERHADAVRGGQPDGGELHFADQGAALLRQAIAGVVPMTGDGVGLPGGTAPVATAEAVGDAASEEAALGEGMSPNEQVSPDEAAPLHQELPPSEPPAIDLVATAPEPEAPVAAQVPEHDHVIEDQYGDPDIADIFVEEAREVLAALAQQVPRWGAEPDDREVLEDVRRGFHTLKGSGRMAGAQVIGEFAWAFENLLNRVRDGRLAYSPALLRLVETALARLPAMVDSFERRAGYDDGPDLDRLRQCAHATAAGEPLSEASLASMSAVGQSGAETTTASAPAIEAPAAPAPAALDDEARELLEIFAEEAGEHLQTIDTAVAEQQGKAPFFDGISPDLQRALHTLKGGANIADIRPMAALVVPVEKLVREMLAYQKPFEAELVSLLADTASACREIIAHLLRGEPAQLPVTDHLVAGAETLWTRHFGESGEGGDNLAVDPTFLNRLMAGGMELVLDADRIVSDWGTGLALETNAIPELVTELGSLVSGARGAGFATIADLAQALADACQRLQSQGGVLSAAQQTVLLDAHETLLTMIDAVAAQQTVPAATEETLTAMAELAGGAEQPQAQTPAPVADAGEPVLPDDADREIVALFLDEADELLETIEQALSGWRDAPREQAHGEALKRALHTFKGGARMAGLTALGSFSHDVESAVMASESTILAGDAAPLKAFFADCDRLVADIAAIRAALAGQPGDSDTVGPAPAPGLTDSDDAIPAYIGRQRGLEQVAQQADGDSGGGDEMIRVAAPVLEALVNLSGESSITRSQVEQHVSEFAGSLEEMEATIRRMQDQVRRLGVETDAQILFRREQIEASRSEEGFDPLEMDHYSQLQQLARSLLESTSDLQDLRNTLVEKSRDTEGLLLQQSRIQAELQEGLTRTRLVPFSRMVPRLRRIVRQVAATTGKDVMLKLDGAEGKLDRTLLERMIPSLEHMIRNAIDHGIEDSNRRMGLGKSAEGTLALRFAREAGDIVISLADDGRGLDLAAIRAKAEERGLIEPGQVLDDQALAQLIFVPGFSTATDITETSGRGVGMDVVANEIRQLGGTVIIDSRAGQGTTFTLRFPFTVSVNRALMVVVGGDAYGLALKSVSGVTRIGVETLQHHYYNPGEPFCYAGESYDITYLGSLLSDDLFPVLDTALGQVPLVLVRTEGRNYALHVDGLIGSQEVVVKSLGRQFGAVQGLSGAAILGDGRVVVILDPLALLRDARAPVPMARATLASHDSSRQSTVMVVDDSVTVRKVTGRLLEREGFAVVTARDGVEAMRMLQDMTPDIMLLDIEMPRMDGFEVARLVRSIPRLKPLPIIMITSRTGEKHREKAFALGVNQYLGKPYQEDVLLDHIRNYVRRAEPQGVMTP